MLRVMVRRGSRVMVRFISRHGVLFAFGVVHFMARFWCVMVRHGLPRLCRSRIINIYSPPVVPRYGSPYMRIRGRCCAGVATVKYVILYCPRRSRLLPASVLPVGVLSAFFMH